MRFGTGAGARKLPATRVLSRATRRKPIPWSPLGAFRCTCSQTGRPFVNWNGTRRSSDEFFHISSWLGDKKTLNPKAQVVMILCVSIA